MKDESRVRRAPQRQGPGGTAPRWRPAPGWQDLLVGRDPEAILARIAEEDPLDLRRLCALRVRASAVLVDPDRVHLGVLSLVAFTASTDGPPDRRRAVVAIVDRAIDEAVAEATLDGLACDGASGIFETFAGPLGLEPEALARACEAFNGRPAGERAAFFALVVDRADLDVAARAAGATPVELARSARRALEAALAAANAGPGSGPAAGAEARGAVHPDRDALEVSDGGR